MKKCPHCGKEYPDEFERCLSDGGFLVGEESQTCTPSPTPQPAAALTERHVRIFEVVLVCLIAFGGPLLNSTYSYFHPEYDHSGQNAFSWMLQSFKEACVLGLVWYVLLRRKKSFADLGFVWEQKDVAWSILLYAAGYLAYHAVYDTIYYCGLTSTTHHATVENAGQILFGGGIFFTTILFQFLNPFFEELIVRAYFMTEIKALTGNVGKAILASTLLQAGYHLYQGAPAAFGHFAEFLIFSIYYAKTNRIAPVILAHLYSDVLGTMFYWMRHH